MSDKSTQPQPQSLDDIVKAAKRATVDQLVRPPYLVESAFARSIVDEYGHRLVPVPNGPIRVLRPNSLSEFYTIDNMDNPLAAFAQELASKTPDEHRLEAVRQHEEAVQEIFEQKDRTFDYRM